MTKHSHKTRHLVPGYEKCHGLGVADRAGLERVCCSFTRVRCFLVSPSRAVPHSCTSSGQQNGFPEGEESATTLLSSSGVFASVQSGGDSMGLEKKRSGLIDDDVE